MMILTGYNEQNASENYFLILFLVKKALMNSFYKCFTQTEASKRLIKHLKASILINFEHIIINLKKHGIFRLKQQPGYNEPRL